MGSLLFLLCDNLLPTSSELIPTFFVTVIADNQYQNTDSLCIKVNGKAMGSPLPEIVTVYLEKQALENLVIAYGNSGVSFSGCLFPENTTGQKTISINCKSGTISSLIYIPDTIITYTSHLNHDTIQSNTSVSVSWTDKMENYFISIFTIDTISEVSTLIRDSSIATNSFTLPASQLSGDLLTIKYQVIGYNGVLLRPGAQANMSGFGHGFLIAQNQQCNYEDRILYLHLKKKQ